MIHEDEAHEQPATDLLTSTKRREASQHAEMMIARRLWADSFLENINADRPAAAMWQVVPANSDGSKRPFGEWKKYQDPQMRMQESEFKRILTQKGDAIGVVTGKASNALLIELEGRAVADGAFELLSDVANASGVAELWQRVANGLVIDTPSGGVHFWVSCIDEVYEYPHNQPLARNEAGEVLAETRGEGGFAIVAPSYGRMGHPEGSRYEFRTRPDGTKCQPADVAPVTGAEIATLLDFVPNVLSTQAELIEDRSPANKSGANRLRPGDDFNARADFARLLADTGWSFVHSAGERDFYRRPNKGEGVSGNLKANVFYNHSTSVSNLPAGKGFTPFTFYTHTEHGGDYKAAAKALALEGYGDPLQVEEDEDETTQQFVPEAEEPDHKPRGAQLLDEIDSLLRRFVYLQHDWQYQVISLWIAGTYCMSAFEYVSRLILVSPQPRCGKSRMLEMIESLSYKGFMTSSISGAYLVRRLAELDEHRMTLMIDEADTVLRRRHDDNAALDNVLNSGFKATGVYSRCEEDNKGKYKVKDFCTFSAVVIASIGTKHFRKATLDRALIIEMQRRLKSEKVEPLRGRQRRDAVAPYSRSLFEWTRGLLPIFKEPGYVDRIKMPEGVEDRLADILEPLIALANEAGGHWPERAQFIAQHVAENQPESDTAAAKLIALMVRLASQSKDGHLQTQTLIRYLNADNDQQIELDDEEPEPIDAEVTQLVRNAAGKITAADISRALKDFGLKSKHRTTGDRIRGYRLADLKAAHERYPVAPPE
jgi:hypothetical protein